IVGVAPVVASDAGRDDQGGGGSSGGPLTPPDGDSGSDGSLGQLTSDASSGASKSGDACTYSPGCRPGATCVAGCGQTLQCNACGQWPGTCGTCVTTFKYTGSNQTFVVPEGITKVTIEASGAVGGCYGGEGGVTTATIAVTPGETL